MRKKLALIESVGLAFGNQYANHFALTARVIGEISIEQLRAALVKVCQRHLFLAARVVTTDDGSWYETDGVADIAIIPFTGEWTDKIVEELPRRFDNAMEPQLSVLLGTGAEFTDLVVILDHAIADGLSGAYLLRDILHYIANPDEVVIPLDVVPPFENILPPVDLSQIERASLPPPVQNSKADSPPPRTLFVVAWSLTEVQTSALVACCRQQGVTVHAALCAAFLSVSARLDSSGSTRRSVSSPVSVRERLVRPVSEQIGTYINSGVRTYLDCTPGRDFWDMARDVKSSLLNTTSDENVFKPIYEFHEMIKSFALSDATFDFTEAPPRAEYDFSITNLGRLDFPVTYGALTLQAIYGPVLNSVIDETIVGVATVGGKLTFSLVSRPSMMSRSTAENIRDRVNHTLADVIGWE